MKDVAVQMAPTWCEFEDLKFPKRRDSRFTGRNQQKGKKPSLVGIFHGNVSHNQMVYIYIFIFHGRLLCFFASPDWMLVRKKIKE